MSKYNKISYETTEINPLIDGEEAIWTGKPKKSAFILNQILTMAPIAIIWLAFDSTFIGMMFAGDAFGGEGIPFGMIIFLIGFFALHLMPVWIWLGNVITASKKWKNTKYYVTDKRIIIQNGFVGESFQTIYYKDIKNVNMHVGIFDKMLGVADIHFELGSSSNTATTNATFLDLENYMEIYPRLQKIVLDIQTDIEYPNAYRPDDNPGYKTKYKG